MKLKLDCIRDTLICLEEHLNMNLGHKVKALSVEEIVNLECMKQYEQKDIIYTLLKLLEAKYIDGYISYGGKDSRITSSSINDISFEGHE